MENPVISLYLIAYNLASMVGWASVASVCYPVALQCLQNQNFDIVENGEFWNTVIYEDYNLGFVVTWVQTAAFLEVLHAALGFVKSPVHTTFLQVFSRLWVVWAVFDKVPVSQNSKFALLCITSWATVEVPRYFFYAWNEMTKMNKEKLAVPYPLKWLRYSLFAVLYPTGITGELGCMYVAFLDMWYNTPKYYALEIQPGMPPIGIPCILLYLFVFIIYIPGSPKMYTYMAGARKKNLSSEDKPKGE
jgi:very-long-chain (3R)-3-hydroxyacyl-CoA dehydratase